MYRFALLLLAAMLSAVPARAQRAADDPAARLAVDDLRARRAALGLTADDVADVAVQDAYVTLRTGVRHVYVQQRHGGLDVRHALATLAVRDGRVVHRAVRFEADVAGRVGPLAPSLPAPSAADAAARALGLAPTAPFTVAASKGGASGEVVLTDGGIARTPVPARLVLQPADDGTIRLAWLVEIDVLRGADWWEVAVDAATGEVLDRANRTIEEQPRGAARLAARATAPRASLRARTAAAAFHAALGGAPPALAAVGTYHVFALPTESPIHGDRTVVTAPADAAASPFGWHDTDGRAGPEHTTTQGNNVWAYEDQLDNDVPGYSPDGTGTLTFDFPFDPSLAPDGNLDAAVTNLFYVSNHVHDVLHGLGFDEAAGNFQVNNYGRGGFGGDAVQAEAQDGGGRNNANFSTPPDGRSPRMQMYVWARGNVAEVHEPLSVAGTYTVGRAAFGPELTFEGVTARLVLADAGPSGGGTRACGPIQNGETMRGQIALIDRGDCLFVDKVRHAQNAGAVAVLVANHEGDDIITLGGEADDVFIPAAMIGRSNGQRLRGLPQPVVLTLRASSLPTDGAFDNGIIIHEYAHGVSNRLTGGPGAASCLSNAEQMGEGWSDFFGLTLTTPPGAAPTTPRGLATFALGQAPNGRGLRSAPYSTDLGTYDNTYGDIRDARISDGAVVPHDVGEVWGGMLWDLYWGYVDRYGYDPDVVRGDGGNARALRLVVDGMKLQPCRPGFVDGRDALLAADTLATGGADACLIWETFARRGLGEDAVQGDANDHLDGLESFDLPDACLNLSTADEDAADLPDALVVHGTYPEPFNPTATLSFDLAVPADVRVDVYDALGRRVLTLPETPYAAGRNRTLVVDAGGLASGVYLYRLTARTGGTVRHAAGRFTVVK